MHRREKRGKKETRHCCPHRNLDVSSYINPFDPDDGSGYRVVYHCIKWNICNQKVSMIVMCRLYDTWVFSYKIVSSEEIA
jgi:hypothetical protein